MQKLVLGVLAAAVSVALVGGASARSEVPVATSLASHRAVAHYLTTLGINPRGVVVQRGARNYAGAHCPGVRWNCTTATHVLQISTSTSSGVNLVSCTGSGGTTTASGSGAGTANLGCTIVQTSTGADNVATCVEQSLVGTPSGVTQDCNIKQTNTSGSNQATVNQSVQQGPLCGLVPSTASSQQTQSATQTATIDQAGPGKGTATVTQDASQCVATFTTGATAQSQTTDQEFTVRQNIPTNFNPDTPNCGPTGALKATVTQGQHQYGFAPLAGSGTEKQHADLLGHIDQCGTGLADYKATQTENQFLGKNTHVQQTQEGPASVKGGRLTTSGKRTLQRGHCCSFQGTNTGDTCKIAQNTSQQANPGATQIEDLTTAAGTSGTCNGSSSATQNATTQTANSSGGSVSTSLQCQSGVCGPLPTALVWSGDVTGAYHDTVNLAATLTRADTHQPVAGEVLKLSVGSASCTTPATSAAGVGSCPVKLKDVPASYQASALFDPTSQYLGTSAHADFVLAKQPTTLSYTGPTAARYHDAVTLTADLKEGTGDPVDDSTPVAFTLDGSPGCASAPTGGGLASCGPLVIGQLPGGAYSVGASFAGNDYYLAPSVQPTETFTVAKRPTVLTYLDATSGEYHDPVTLRAKLTEDVTGAPADSGRTVIFTLGASTLTCSGTTDGTGVASCTIPNITQLPGSVTAVSATFDGTGDLYYVGSSTSSPFQITPGETIVKYTGATSADYSDPAALKATLTEDDGTTPIAGRTLTFTLGVDHCSAPTNSSGVASCTINKVSSASGGTTVRADFAGDSTYLASFGTKTFTVTTEESDVHYTGPTSAKKGTSATVSAKLFWDDGPIAGRTFTFTLGSSTCSATTNASGVASCSLAVGSTTGYITLKAKFAGDTYFEPSSASVSFRVTS